MGWKDFMDRHRGKRTDRQIERQAKRIMNAYMQTAERKRCIDTLYALGTPEAIAVMLKRFTYRTEGAIVDEDEKQLLYDRLISLGPKAVEPLVGFIMTEQAVYWPIKALTEITGRELAINTLLAAIDELPDAYGQNLVRKEQLVSNLRQFEDERVYTQLANLLSDPAEEIRFLAVDGIMIFGDRAQPLLLERLANDDETVRVKTQIIEMYVENKWKVDKKHKSQIIDYVPEHYWIGDTGVIMRK